jgi:hypothetical protein
MMSRRAVVTRKPALDKCTATVRLARTMTLLHNGGLNVFRQMWDGSGW